MLRLLLLVALFFVVEPFAAPAARSSDVHIHHGHGSSSSSTALQLQDSRRQFFSACATTAATLVTTTFLTPSDANAKGTTKGGSVNFSNVQNGDTVPSTFTYQFAVTGLELSPAKEGLLPGTGHHHVIIDDPKGFVAKGIAIPFDATHKHYGKAQTEGELELEQGTHTITLQFANALHESYGKDFAKTITVTVL